MATLGLKQNSAEAKRVVSDWLLDKLPGAQELEISSWEVASDGFSNQTVCFDAHWRGVGIDQKESLVLRQLSDNHTIFMGADLRLQWQMMDSISRQSTVPVPNLRWADWDGQLLGAPFFVMDRVLGRAPQAETAEWILEMSTQDRTQLMENGLEAMAEIHRLDWLHGFEFLDHPERGDTGLDQYLDWIEEWLNWVRGDRSFKLYEQALAEMRHRQPQNQTIGVIWGDSRIGNMIFRKDNSVAAVLDWEMATLGPAELDLGWWFMMQRFMNLEMGQPLPKGVPNREETIRRYEQLLGRPMEDMAYYEILATLRFAIINTRLADLCIKGGVLDPKSTMPTNNVPSRILAELLDLPLPEISPDCENLLDTLRELMLQDAR